MKKVTVLALLILLFSSTALAQDAAPTEGERKYPFIT
jgi:hypothetical protein